MQFKFLPHTADVKFQAFGKTLEEAFQNCAYALTETITNYKKIKPTTEKTIEIESENNESLLYDFLEQFLILLDSEGFILNKIKSLKITKNKLKATIVGDTKPENYKINTHIKAVTYQQMFIKKQDNQYIIQVILDI
ncbi:MAG: archease [Nanoarchaeota archaeon]|nr:archease [Nanoarchaeota archaeon]